jgi:DNA-binding PadR family transcriptional regulator
MLSPTKLLQRFRSTPQPLPKPTPEDLGDFDRQVLSALAEGPDTPKTIRNYLRLGMGEEEWVWNALDRLEQVGLAKCQGPGSRYYDITDAGRQFSRTL